MSITFNMLRTFQDVIRGISVIGDEIGDMNSSTCDSEITIVGFLSIMIFTTVGDSSQVTDTCGHYFFLPMFPACELFLEVIPCFNDTPNVIVTMSTPAGDVVHSFLVVFGATTELPLHSINKPKYEGLIVRSNEDISVYLHNTSGDSMIIFPIDALARDYEIPRLASYKDFREKSSRNSAKNYHDGALYIFSPFNNTSITIAQLYDARESTSPFSSSHSSSIYSSPFSTTTVKLDAFEIYEYHIDTFRRYRLHSADVFAIILIQTSNKFYDNGSLCGEARLSLIDFVPPYSVRGKYFYLAFPKVTEFRLFVTGLENTSLDLTTDTVSRELFLDHSGNFMTVVSRTSSAWITASQPVSIYIKMTLCSNASSPSAKMCAENGFFLPSVEHYFTCDGNLSKGVCLCTCPSFFQRETNPSNFHILRNSSKARPTTIYPLLVGELFDVTTSIIESIEYKDSDDVIVTTNTTFLIFRFDLDNLNFLPAGTTLGNVYKVCVPNMYTVLFHACEDIEPSEETKHRQLAMNPPDSNQCSCEFFQDAVLFPVANGDSNNKYNLAGSSGGKSRPSGGGGNDFVWVEEDDDTARPLIAVVVSLCVSIFAVIALISGYMLVEMTTRRKHVRNTKIRPFVS